MPTWAGPPHNVLPAPFMLEAVLAQTDDVVIQVHTGRAYVEGFAFVLSLILREERHGHLNHPLIRMQPVGPELPDELFRFGIELSDGRKATNLTERLSPDEKTPGVVLQSGSGGGSGYGWDSNYWVWPTPPPGPLAFVVEWPSEGIPLTRTEIDTEPIREASARAKELWPRDPSASSGDSIGISVMRMSAVAEKPEGSDPGQTPDVA